MSEQCAVPAVTFAHAREFFCSLYRREHFREQVNRARFVKVADYGTICIVVLQDNVHILARAHIETQTKRIRCLDHAFLAELAAFEHEMHSPGRLIDAAVEVEIGHQPIQPLRHVPVVHVLDRVFAVENARIFGQVFDIIVGQKLLAVAEFLARTLGFRPYIAPKWFNHCSPPVR